MTSPINKTSLTPQTTLSLDAFMKSDSLNRKEAVKKEITALVAQLNVFDQTIQNRIKETEGWYAMPENPSYSEDIHNKYACFNKIAAIAKNEFGVTLTL